MVKEHIGTCTFSSDMSRLFAQLSGDCNPMHLDEEAARCTYFGQTIVHGIHLVLQGCELLCSEIGNCMVPRQVKVSFNKPVATGNTVEYTIIKEPSEKLVRMNGICQGSQVFRAVIYLQDTPLPSPSCPPEKTANLACQPFALQDKPLEFDLLQLEDLKGEVQLDYTVMAKELRNLFPRLLRSWPLNFLHGMLSTTYVVGMRAPGLHSIFSSIDICWDCGANTIGSELVRFRVVDLRSTIRRCEIEAEGNAWRATLQAFIRPKPCMQPKYLDLAEKTEQGVYAGQRAFVLGGSRGIGECTAKLLAAGGADVVLTYAVSEKSANSVVTEITSSGGKARTVTFKVEGENSVIDALPSGWRPTHLYYFVTPPIVGDRFEFSQTNFDRYFHYYATLFAQVVTELRKESKCLRCVLWPSSVAVTEVPQGMVEYAMAKSAGEVLCQALMRVHPGIVIHMPRLPRIRTDLTANPLVADGFDAAEIMVPILAQMTISAPIQVK